MRPSPARRTVVLGFLGSTLDTGRTAERWERWRPTVSVCQHPDLLVHRFEIFHDPRFQALFDTVAADIRSVSPETTVRSVPMPTEDPWDFEEVYARLHDFARGYPFSPDEEDYLVHITTGTHVAQICLFLLTESRHLPGRLLQTSPSRGKADKRPEGYHAVIDLDLSRYDRLASRAAVERSEGESFLKGGIDTKNPAYNRLIEQIERVAIASRTPILLTGPTGAGKSQLARRIYELKRARHKLSGELVDVNCATIRGDSAMSALFGHTKGAFTGALEARQGLLRKANGGVLFLDEIGELGLDEQAMLLRAIEEKVFYPVGSDREQKSDFQLVAGTNRDLQDDVAAGRFREDLHARINLWTFRLPSLAERPEDIEPNLDFELGACASRTGVHVTMSREARARFLAFATSKEALWLHNFRDFSAAITRMAVLSSGGRVRVEGVEEEIGRLRASWRRSPRKEAAPHDPVTEALGADAAAEIDRFDRVQLADVLTVCKQARSLSEAGRELFAASRAKKTSVNDADRLRKYLARFGLSWADLATR
jgi:transcriptional regulatory protein RtcR